MYVKAGVGDVKESFGKSLFVDILFKTSEILWQP
jgi:hypothetical protein